MDIYNDMTLSEKISCFVDGELSTDESTNLFYELANKPEYQNELRQMLLIKNTFKNTMISAPVNLKSNVLKNTVNKDSYYSKLANALSLLITYILSKGSLTYAGIGILTLTAMILISDSIDNNSPNQSTNSMLLNTNIPDISSKEILTQNPKQDNNIINTDSKTKENQLAHSAYTTNNPNIKHRFTDIKIDNIYAQKINDNTNNISEQVIENINHSDFTKNNYTNFDFDKSGASEIYYNNSNNRFLNKISLSLKKFDGTSFPNFNLPNQNSDILNNFSLALNYNIDYNQSIGLVLGFENFLMNYNKLEGDILYNYRQNYNTQWLGLQYNYTLDQIAESGLRPNLNLIAGATNIGPILKIGAGVTYHINDYFSLTAGVESGWLFYSNNGNLINGDLYNTQKIGYNIGLNLGL